MARAPASPAAAVLSGGTGQHRSRLIFMVKIAGDIWPGRLLQHYLRHLVARL
jgi:hypothetical protein